MRERTQELYAMGILHMSILYVRLPKQFESMRNIFTTLPIFVGVYFWYFRRLSNTKTLAFLRAPSPLIQAYLELTGKRQ